MTIFDLETPAADAGRLAGELIIDSQVARIGNSVCPPIAKAVVAANFCREGVHA